MAQSDTNTTTVNIPTGTEDVTYRLVEGTTIVFGQNINLSDAVITMSPEGTLTIAFPNTPNIILENFQQVAESTNPNIDMGDLGLISASDLLISVIGGNSGFPSNQYSEI